MFLIVSFLVALLALGLAAPAWGPDSRPGLPDGHGSWPEA